ncbi:MAG: peptide chain release factor N(5)-glutamine methyltransferase [Candidatus Ancillula sp.]|nr:peptide chain release factor N(5)-glutamine methyltransferase [Candidatus Ancillula sp.]
MQNANAENIKNETLAQFIRHQAYLLEDKHGFRYKTAVFEVELLLGWFLKLDINQIRTCAITGQLTVDAFSTYAVSDFCGIMKRRLNGEPLQYITGSTHFYGLTLKVGPGVFIPRPETEGIVSLALEFVQKFMHFPIANTASRKVVLADLCAGSGAIGLAVAQSLQNFRSEHFLEVVAVEKFTRAFNYLKVNCTQYAAQNSKSVIIPILGDAGEIELPVCDIVVINPPYIPSEIELPSDVHVEPKTALYGLGEDGFEIPRAVIKNAAQSLKSGGYLLIEHFETQNEVAEKTLQENGLSEIKHIQDLNHRPRFTIGIKN